MEKMKKFLPIIFVLILSYWSIAPLFQSGFFPIHDDTQVARVHQMHKALSDGMFPVRWVPDLGYGFGYPIFNFYAPFSYYIGAFLMLLGFGALPATKIMIGAGVLMAGVSMYLLAREFWGKLGGVVSALLYVYAPYHALNIYVRGAIAELWAYGLMPLVFFSIYKVFLSLNNYLDLESKSKTQSKFKKVIWNYVFLVAISYAAIIISHNLTAMMVTPFIFVFAVFLYIRLRKRVKIYKPYFVLLGLLIGIMISAFYWLPVPFEMKFTDVLSVVGGGSDFRDHFVCLSQLWNSPWGYAGSAPGCIDGFSLKIGKLHMLLGSIALVLLPVLYRKDKSRFYINILFVIFLIFSIYLTNGASKFLWELIPPMAFFQFPWRFLAVSVFYISFLAGGSIWFLSEFITSKNLNKNFLILTSSLVMIVIIYMNAKVFVPQTILSKNSDDYTNKQTLNWEVSKLSDEYMPPNFLKPIGPKGVVNSRFAPNDSIKILSIEEKTGRINTTIEATNSAQLSVNLAYFPGWHVYIDGSQEWFGYSADGIMIDVPKGRHKLDIIFTQTPIERVGNAISLAGIIMLFVGIISHRKI